MALRNSGAVARAGRSQEREKWIQGLVGCLLDEPPPGVASDLATGYSS